MQLRHYSNLILILFVVLEHIMWSVFGYYEKITHLYIVTAEIVSLCVLIIFCYNMLAKRHTDLGLIIIMIYSIGSIILLVADQRFHLNVFESDAQFNLMDFFVFIIVNFLYLLAIAIYSKKQSKSLKQ